MIRIANQFTVEIEGYMAGRDEKVPIPSLSVFTEIAEIKDGVD